MAAIWRPRNGNAPDNRVAKHSTVKLKLACADFTFPLLSHGQALELIATLEFDGVDIGLFEQRAHLWPSREFRGLERSAQRLWRVLSDLGLEPADVFLQIGTDFRACAINHPQRSRRQKARDWFLNTLDYTLASGGHHVTILPGVSFENESYSTSLGRSMEELAWRVEQAEKQNVVFGIEPHVGSIIMQPRQLEKLVRNVPGLTLTLDYTHFVRRGLSVSSVEPLLRHDSHFHVRGARPGRLQESFKRNVIDYTRAFGAMRACGYRGWIGIEYVWTDWERCNECDNLSETILFRDFFRSFADQR
jgi:sugar phosphate isomerase/epimerase